MEVSRVLEGVWHNIGNDRLCLLARDAIVLISKVFNPLAIVSPISDTACFQDIPLVLTAFCITYRWCSISDCDGKKNQQNSEFWCPPCDQGSTRDLGSRRECTSAWREEYSSWEVIKLELPPAEDDQKYHCMEILRRDRPMRHPYKQEPFTQHGPLRWDLYRLKLSIVLILNWALGSLNMSRYFRQPG